MTSCTAFLEVLSKIVQGSLLAEAHQAACRAPALKSQRDVKAKAFRVDLAKSQGAGDGLLILLHIRILLTSARNGARSTGSCKSCRAVRQHFETSPLTLPDLLQMCLQRLPSDCTRLEETVDAHQFLYFSTRCIRAVVLRTSEGTQTFEAKRAPHHQSSLEQAFRLPLLRIMPRYPGRKA